MLQLVLESLLRHLGKHAVNVLISTAIVQVLNKVVVMTAESVAGLYLLDFLRTLVSHLKTNISQAHSSSEVRTFILCMFTYHRQRHLYCYIYIVMCVYVCVCVL